MIYEVLPSALQCGMSVGEFWDISLAEVTTYIEAYNEREKHLLRLSLQVAYELGDVIGNRVSMIFSKENTVEPMTLEEVHPDLFGIVDEGVEKSSEDEAVSMAYAEKQAASRRAFAQKWNPILREKYGLTQTPSSNRSEYTGAEEGNRESESGSQQVQERC